MNRRDKISAMWQVGGLRQLPVLIYSISTARDEYRSKVSYSTWWRTTARGQVLDPYTKKFSRIVTASAEYESFINARQDLPRPVFKQIKEHLRNAAANELRKVILNQDKP